MNESDVNKAQQEWLEACAKIGSRDFSDAEDHPDFLDLLQKLGRITGLKAAAEAKAAGLRQVFARDNKIIRLYPDGSEEVLTTAEEEGIEGGTYFIPRSALLKFGVS